MTLPPPSKSTALVRRASIEELIGHRNRAMEEYERCYAALKSARDACKLAHPSFAYGADQLREDSLETIRKELDRRVWRHVLMVSGLESLMDKRERAEFEKQLEKEPPVCTVDTVFATVERLLGEADAIFRRGLVSAFCELDGKRYKRNSQFKIAMRVAREWCMSAIGADHSWQDFNHYSNFARDLADIERVMCVLDGKAFPMKAPAIGIVDAIRSRCSAINRREAAERKAENEYFKAQWYKKGSMHIEFKRRDLVDKANRLIAQHFGEVLADAAA